MISTVLDWLGRGFAILFVGALGWSLLWFLYSGGLAFQRYLKLTEDEAEAEDDDEDHEDEDGEKTEVKA